MLNIYDRLYTDNNIHEENECYDYIESINNNDINISNEPRNHQVKLTVKWKIHITREMNFRNTPTDDDCKLFMKMTAGLMKSMNMN